MVNLPLSRPFNSRKLVDLTIAVAVFILLPLGSPAALADAREDHLSRYHPGYASAASAEQLREARLGVLGYSARKSLESMGVDYQQAKRVFKHFTEHAITDHSAVLIEPDKINFQTLHQNGAFVTEFSGKPDGEIGLSINMPF